jgi:hypothetical protein
VYQQDAFVALGQIAAARTDIDMTETVFDIVSPVVEDLTSPGEEDSMDVDAGDGKKDEGLRDRILIGAVKAVQDSIRPTLLQGSGK